MEECKYDLLAKKIDKMISISGYGRYQMILFIILFLYYGSLNTFRQSIPYLLKPPKVEINGTNQTITQEICRDPNFNVTNVIEDFSWIFELGIYCEKLKSQLIIICYYAGCLLGALFLFLSANSILLLRKKNIIYAGSAFSLLILICTLSRFYFVILILTSLLGFFFSIGFISNVALIVESNSTCRRGFFSIFMIMASAVVGMTLGLLFNFFRSWRLNFCLFAGMNLVTIIFIIFKGIESSRIYLSIRDLDNFFKTLHKIAIVNQQEEKFNSIFEPEDLDVKSKASLLEISENLVVNRHLDERDEMKKIVKEISKKFSYEMNESKSINLTGPKTFSSRSSQIPSQSIIDLLLLNTLWFITYAIGYNPFFINNLVENFGSDTKDLAYEIIYSSTFAFEIILTTIFYIMIEINWIGRRRAMIVSFIYCFLSCLVIIFGEIHIKNDAFNIIVLIANIFIKVGKNILILYSAELYSTRERIKFLCINWIFGILGVYVSTFIYYVEEDVIVYFHAIISILSVTIIGFLGRETSKRCLLDFY